MEFGTIVHEIRAILDQEQHSNPVTSLEEYEARWQRRELLRSHLKALDTEVRALREQAKRMPALPPMSTVRWAQAMFAMPNLAFLEVDTTGLGVDAEIVRLTVFDAREHLLLDQLVKPSMQLSQQTTSLTGITGAQVNTSGVSIQIALDQLRRVIRGRYILSYNMNFDRTKLSEATQRLQSEEIFFVGEDLMQHAMQYFSLSAYPRLEQLCRQAGFPLPDPPNQTSLDRARGQIRLLRVMTTGVTEKIPLF
jgi:DNA polymerase III epsilon subunit-like protein